jgi:sugar phosphate permease
MIRNHGMTPSSLGVGLGLIFGFGGMAGTLLGGYVSARWLGSDEGGQMRLSAMTVALLIPCMATFLLAPAASVALAALTPTVVLGNFVSGPPLP